MKKNLSPKGFTYIEVIFSLLIFSIVLVPILDILQRGNRQSIESERSTVALYIAQSILERLTNTSFDQIITVVNQPCPNRPDHNFTYSVTVVSDLIRYDSQGQINIVNDPGAIHRKHITVTVNYTIDNIPHQVALSMEKTDRDVKADSLQEP